MPDMHETILAFDFGLRRIGIAVGQQVTESAGAVGTVSNGESGPDWRRIESYLSEWQPARLIVGMPFHADGRRAELANSVDAFIQELQRFNLPIESIDERYSSIDAEQRLKASRAAGLRGRISKESIDSAAAVTIAERWLATATIS